MHARLPALVCFPYAGGNAVNFQPMASALRGQRGWRSYAVELPGHDLAAESEPFAPLAQVVDQVVDEITERGLTRVCSGATPPAPRSPWRQPGGCRSAGWRSLRVFLAAQLLGNAADRRAAIAELARAAVTPRSPHG